mgnify:CR=1 FL=1
MCDYVAGEPLDEIQKFGSHKKARRKGLDSLFNWAAFYLPCMFPKAGRILYLDTDVIVKGDVVRELAGRDLGGRPAAAVKEFTKLLKMAPEDPYAFFERALAYRMTGQSAKAVVDFQKAYDFGMRKVKAKAKVPGFRDGKVPTALLRKRFGDIIEAEGLDQIFQENVPKAVLESEIRPVVTPRVKEATETLDPNGEFSFVLECDVLPKLESVDYSGLEVPAAEVSVSDEDVQAEISQIQKRHADAVPVTDKPCEIGNKVQFTYYGNAGTTEIPEDQAVTNEVELGEEKLVSEMQDALPGMKIGDSTELNFTYADDFPTEELRGQEANLHITVTNIHELVFPDMDDELAKSVGLETLDELRARVREDMERNQEEQNREQRQNQLYDLLLEKNAFEVPERLVHDTVHNMQNLYHQSLVGQGLDPEAAARLIRETSANASPMAERQIKIDHLLSAIREKEEISVEPQDLETVMAQESQRTGMPLPRLKARYSTGEAKMRLESRVMREKLIAFLLGDSFTAPEETEVEAPEPEEPTAPQETAEPEEAEAPAVPDTTESDPADENPDAEEEKDE